MLGPNFYDRVITYCLNPNVMVRIPLTHTLLLLLVLFSFRLHNQLNLLKNDQTTVIELPLSQLFFRRVHDLGSMLALFSNCLICPHFFLNSNRIGTLSVLVSHLVLIFLQKQSLLTRFDTVNECCSLTLVPLFVVGDLYHLT